MTILSKLEPDSEMYKWLYSDEILDEQYEGRGRDNSIRIQLPRFAFYTVVDALNILKRLRAVAEREGITLMKDPYADIEKYVRGIRGTEKREAEQQNGRQRGRGQIEEEDGAVLLESVIEISNRTIKAGRMDVITTLVHEARHIALHNQRSCLDDYHRELNCFEAEADCINALMAVDNLRKRSNRDSKTYWDEYGLDFLGQRYDKQSRQIFLEFRKFGLNLGGL